MRSRAPQYFVTNSFSSVDKLNKRIDVFKLDVALASTWTLLASIDHAASGGCNQKDAVLLLDDILYTYNVNVLANRIEECYLVLATKQVALRGARAGGKDLWPSIRASQDAPTSSGRPVVCLGFSRSLAATLCKCRAPICKWRRTATTLARWRLAAPTREWFGASPSAPRTQARQRSAVDGARTRRWTTVGVDGAAGSWTYMANYGGGWNGPFVSSLGAFSWTDFAYVAAHARTSSSFHLVGQSIVGAYSACNGVCFRAGVGAVDLTKGAAGVSFVELGVAATAPSVGDIYVTSDDDVHAFAIRRAAPTALVKCCVR